VGLVWIVGVALLLAVGLAWSYRRRRAAVDLVAPDGGLCLRLRSRPRRSTELSHALGAALHACGYRPSRDGWWRDDRGRRLRVAPPVLGDRETLVEATTASASEILEAVIGRHVAEGWSVRQPDDQRVVLRRGWRRIRVAVGPG
jgi:hypothetical protein